MTWRSSALAISCAFVLSGCPVGPNFVRPPPPKAKQYTAEPTPESTVKADGVAQLVKMGRDIPGDWWRVLNCEKLNVIVAEAIANNPSLQAAQASLRQSQDNLRAGYGIFFPQASVAAGASRQQYTPVRFGINVPPTVLDLFTLSASVTYALDVFGGERRTVERLGALAEAQRDATMATYIMLTGNLINTLVAEAAYRDQIRITNELLALEKEEVDITTTEAKAGVVPYANVLTLEGQYEITRASLPPLQQRVDQAEHLTAVLMGRTPAEWKGPELKLADFTLPRDVPVSLPSALVQQRPDILQAEAEVHAANAQIGVATAAMLPNFALSGDYGVNSTTLSNLFSPRSVFWGLGASIAAPVFQGGTLWFQRKAAIAAHEQSLANYRQTVLAAFQQVADTLRALSNDAEAVDGQSRAVQATEEGLHLVHTNYEAGTANYVQVLIAGAQYRQAETGYIVAQAQRIQDTVALYVALGGGWWNAPPLPQPKP